MFFSRFSHWLPGLIVTATVIFTSSVDAKSSRFDRPETDYSGVLNGAALRSLENRLQPFFENRILRRHYRKAPETETLPPLERDLLLMAKAWNLLSPQFRHLYKRAAHLPDSFQRYDSPGGHFEIFYTTSGLNGVDIADDYGFLSTNWRERTPHANGIPDYIDETAFALDSSWSMEIDRFGFIAPSPHKDDNHQSERYKVVVEAQDVSYYGMTYLHDSLPEGRGYTSTISLRNDWSGAEWSGLGYDLRPVDGMRVTCAHEFFHAIQYAMCWNVLMYAWLDDFPLSWTEGTAVTMEELAFDSVNDYHQYARTYFSNPGISFFSPAASDVVYTNSILLLYLFQHFPPGNSIEFIRSIQFTNYTHRTPFHENVFTVTDNAGRSWVRTLHDFHTASFSTGPRADTAIFIADAEHFTMRTAGAVPITAAVRRTVALNSAEHIRLLPGENHGDSLTLFFSGDAVANGRNPGAGWACSVLLRKQNAELFLAMNIDEHGKGTATVTPWKEYQEIVIVITNGDPVTLTREVTLSFQLDSIPGDTIPYYHDITVFPNPVSLQRQGGKVVIRGSDISDISIYTVTGSLMWRFSAAAAHSSVTGAPGQHTWDCTRSGAAAVPGTYTVVVVRDDPSSVGPLRTRHKLLVTP
ncbi:MAG: hypothetical protein JXA18_16840 [Chitinispirillaceae bacterium]|nr:hypothetical protein [Chitinispirillaceae bacterium]